MSSKFQPLRAAVRYIADMRLTVSAGPPRWRKTLPWFGMGAAVMAALILIVGSLWATHWWRYLWLAKY
jgi:hypothetical protein